MTVLTNRNLQRHAAWATIVGGWTAAVSLTVGAWSFWITNSQQRDAAEASIEAATVAMLHDHYQLRAECSQQQCDLLWIDADAFTVAEAVLNLRGDENSRLQMRRVQRRVPAPDERNLISVRRNELIRKAPSFRLFRLRLQAGGDPISPDDDVAFLL